MVKDLTYGGVMMPDVRGVHGSTVILISDWHVEGRLPDGRRFCIHVEAGFVFDGASIPRALWRLCGHPLETPRIAAALAHDWLYAAHVTDRKTADMIFRAICVRVGMVEIRSDVEYAALRIAGDKAWKGHGKDDEIFARAHGALVLEGETMKGTDKQ